MKKTLFLFALLGSMMLVSPAMARTHSRKAAEKVRTISVDYNQVKGDFNHMFRECVGAGRANEGLRADWQQQLAVAHKDCGFQYIRMHGLLTDDMGVCKINRKGEVEYNFQYIDALYDYILSIGMKPFVELGFMPNALASGDKTIFWWRGNVTPPRDYNQWADLIRHLVQHFTQRYGADEVKTWYFEVWNEPNLSGFWAGTQQQYFRLYKYTAEAIKGIDKDYRVGGPATAGAAWVPEMISFCEKNQVPIDFISTHTYGVKQGFLDEYGTTGTVLNKDKWAVSGDVIHSRKQISESSMSNLELHYTEWSASYTPADPIHDSYHEAAYILEKLKQVGNAANSMSYWTFTDIFEEAGPRFTPFHGGFGLMNYQGIKKPAFFAYSYLNKMGKTELQDADSASWACKDADGDMQLLFWDFTYTLPDSVNNQAYYIKNLPSKPKGKVNVELSGVPAGKYQMEVYRIGYEINDPYTTYYQLGRPKQLTRQEVAFIKKKNSGAPVAEDLIQVDATGKFSKEFPLRENDVYLVKLVKL